ncbi:metal-dependent hydrolase [Homoserinimonas sp. A447]
MALPTTDTIVTYPAGATGGTATVLHTELLDDGLTAVLLDATPCHPVDAGWPDQGPDRATIAWGPTTADVMNCVVGATDGTQLHLGADIPVRKGTEGWAFVVAHLLEVAPPEGQEVTVAVDAGYRRELSLGHTACHLASLALNRALADRWTKEAPTDALGSPDFDQAANDTSTIVQNGSFDTYRLNKSLRRKGFVTDGFAEALPAVTDAVNAQLASWVAAGAPVRIDRDGELLTDRRQWVCSLPDGEAMIPCGGTHASALSEIGDLRVTLSLDTAEGTPVFTMRTATT